MASGVCGFNKHMSKPFTYLISLVFVLSALVFPNQSLYIGDELSYLNRGFAIAQFERELNIRDHFSHELIDLIPADYPLGNSFFIAGSIPPVCLRKSTSINTKPFPKCWKSR